MYRLEQFHLNGKIYDVCFRYLLRYGEHHVHVVVVLNADLLQVVLEVHALI